METMLFAAMYAYEVALEVGRRLVDRYLDAALGAVVDTRQFLVGFDEQLGELERRLAAVHLDL